MSETEEKEELPETKEEEVEPPVEAVEAVEEKVTPEEEARFEETTETEVEETAETVPAAEEKEGEAEEEIEVVEERIYTIPLRHTWVITPRGKRAPRAVRDVRAFVSRHMKAEEVSVSDEINKVLWARGINKPPRKIKIRAVKDKEGKVIIYPARAA